MKISDGPIVFVKTNEKYVPINDQEDSENAFYVTEIFLKDSQIFIRAENDHQEQLIMSQKDFLGEYNSV